MLCELSFDVNLFHPSFKPLGDAGDVTTRVFDVPNDDDGSYDDDENEHMPKRRKTWTELVAQYKKKSTVPRVLVQDIRKVYAKMFVNVMNSTDFPLMFGFLDTYFSRNVQYVTTMYRKTVPDKLYTMSFHGMEEVAKYLFCIQRMSPDSMLELKNMTIQHTTGKVNARMRFTATLLHADHRGRMSYFAPYIAIEEKYGEKDACERLTDNDYLVGYGKDKCDELIGTRPSLHDVKLMRSIEASVENVVASLPLRGQQTHFACDAEYVIHTDEHKRITKLEAMVVWNN